MQRELRRTIQLDSQINAKRIQRMYKIDEELREKFITANDFIRDCEEKERVADKKIVIELENHAAMEKEIQQLTDDLQVVRDFDKRLAATVEEFKPYQTVIEQVVEESELYKDTKDLIDRCDALSINIGFKYFLFE